MQSLKCVSISEFVDNRRPFLNGQEVLNGGLTVERCVNTAYGNINSTQQKSPGTPRDRSRVLVRDLTFPFWVTTPHRGFFSSPCPTYPMDPSNPSIHTQ